MHFFLEKSYVKKSNFNSGFKLEPLIIYFIELIVKEL